MKNLIVFYHIPCRTIGEVWNDYHSLLCYGCGQKIDMEEFPDEFSVQNVPWWFIESPDQSDYFPSYEE